MKRVPLMLALLLVAALPVLAQRAPWPSEYFHPQQRQGVPGEFDYYILVLSWSPTYCLTAERGRDDAQCNPRDGRRHGFVLHGLWPQYERGYPERCHTRWRPFVPEPVITSMRDIMPSKGLLIHEYRTHGTCSGLQPGSYFTLARAFYNRIKVPDRYSNPLEPITIAPGELMHDLQRANPGFSPDMMEITCGDDRLAEIRFCMTKTGLPRRCTQTRQAEVQCRASEIKLPPVRSRSDYGGEGSKQPDLPRPRVIESPRPL